MFQTLKRKYQRKKRDLKETNKSGTSTEIVSKAEKAFRPYAFLNWLDDFFATRQGKTNLPSTQLNLEDEDEECEEEEDNEDFAEGNTPLCTEASTSVRKPRSDAKKQKQRSEIKGSARENLLDDMEFSLIKDLHEKVSKKRKADDQETAEDLFCKLLAADLKELPTYERFIARNEIRGIMFKLQMSALRNQQNQQQPTNPPHQTYFGSNYLSPQHSTPTGSWTGNPMSSPTSSGSWGEQ